MTGGGRGLLTLGLLVAACGAEPPVAPSGPVRLVITASDTVTGPNHTLTFTATAEDRDGQVVEVTGVGWFVPDSMRGRITAAGTFTGGPWVGPVWVHANLAEPALSDSLVVRVVPHGTPRWVWAAAEAGGTLPLIGGPALGLDGSVYVIVETNQIADEARVVALDTSGRPRWTVDVRGIEVDYPIVTPAGDVAVTGKRMYLLHADGSVVWDFLTDARGASARAAAATEDVLVAAQGLHVTAYRLPTADTLWQSTVGPFSDWLVPPTIVANSHVYAKKTEDTLFVFRLADGAILKTFVDPDTGVDKAVFGAGTVPVGDRFYLPTWNRLAAFDTAGPLLWLTQASGRGTTEPAVGPDGTLYIQNRGWGLQALNADGTTKWYRKPGVPRWPQYGGPALAKGGIIYAAGLDAFYAYDTAGNQRWRYVADTAHAPDGFPVGAFVGAPAIGPDGTVYSFTATHVYAFWGSAPPEPNSPWPMWRHDAQRTGWAR